MNRTHNMRGFTMIEMIIAVAIFAVIAAAIYSFFLTFNNATDESLSYYKVHERAHKDYVALDRYLTGAYSVTFSAGTDQINGLTRTITFNQISSFSGVTATPTTSAQTLVWVKTTNKNEQTFGFDGDKSGSLDNHNVGTLTHTEGGTSTIIGDSGTVIEPIISLAADGKTLTWTIKRIDDKGFIATRTLQTFINPATEANP